MNPRRCVICRVLYEDVRANFEWAGNGSYRYFCKHNDCKQVFHRQRNEVYAVAKRSPNSVKAKRIKELFRNNWIFVDGKWKLRLTDV